MANAEQRSCRAKKKWGTIIPWDNSLGVVVPLFVRLGSSFSWPDTRRAGNLVFYGSICEAFCRG